MATVMSRPVAAAPRTAVLTSADLSFRQRLRDTLTELRWQVRSSPTSRPAHRRRHLWPILRRSARHLGTSTNSER